MDHTSIRVLHVDDDPEVGDLTATFLERQNDRFVVQKATSAAEARNSIEAHPPDCVISDYDMPGKNGIEFLRTVREGWPEIPFILFTGKGSEEIASEAISAGVTDYLQKETGVEQYKLLANRIETAVGQYHAERELDRKNDLFKKAQVLADIGAWEWNRSTKEGYYSERVYDIYEIDERPEMSPRSDIEEFYHPDDQKQLLDAFETAIETGKRYDIEVRVVTDDGTEKWVRTSGDPQFEDGECVRIRGTIQNITARKEREQELRSEREFIQKSLNTLTDIFYLVDTEGNFQRWNETLPELTEYTDGEIGSMNALEFFEGEHRESIELAIRDILQTGSNVTEAKITTKDGRQIPHEFRGVRMTDDAGNPTGIIGIARDITSRKRRESDLKAERDRLDEFASVISHDLRSPLQVAEGRLELAHEECDSPHLQDVSDAHRRMEQLIEDLLGFARMGSEAIDRRTVSLRQLLADSWDSLRGEDATLAIETERTVRADRDYLRQLVTNLLRNSVEHGGADVSITVGDLDDGFYLEDDGPGIPESERTAVFDAGYSSGEGGTGFGLSIVKQVAEAHGWDIRLIDGRAGGVRFEVIGVEFDER